MVSSIKPLTRSLDPCDAVESFEQLVLLIDGMDIESVEVSILKL